MAKRQYGNGSPTLSPLDSAVDYAFGLHTIYSHDFRANSMPTATIASSHAVCFLFTPTVSKTLNGFAVNCITATGTPSPIWELYATTAGKPTGSPLATTTSAVALAGGGAYSIVTFTAGYACIKGTQYALVPQTVGATGTSYIMQRLPSTMVHGWGAMYTTALNATIGDTIWRDYSDFAPPIHLNWSDGTQQCACAAIGDGTANTGQVALYGDPASGSAGRFAGIAMRPNCDIAIKKIMASCRLVGTAATANAIEFRIYRLNSSGVPDSLLQTSSNQISAVSDLASATSHAFVPVKFTNFTYVEKGASIAIVACQSGVGGLSDPSNYIHLNGVVGGGYTTNAYPPETHDENVNHGIYSVSSTTGIEDLVKNTTVIPFMGIGHYPYRR